MSAVEEFIKRCEKEPPSQLGLKFPGWDYWLTMALLEHLKECKCASS